LDNRRPFAPQLTAALATKIRATVVFRTALLTCHNSTAYLGAAGRAEIIAKHVFVTTATSYRFRHLSPRSHFMTSDMKKFILLIR
jgi:hypothetical protein